MFSCCVGRRVCPEVIPDQWIRYNNSYASGGVASSASDLTSCQSSCITDISCTRIDWRPLATTGNVILLNYRVLGILPSPPKKKIDISA